MIVEMEEMTAGVAERVEMGEVTEIEVMEWYRDGRVPMTEEVIVVVVGMVEVVVVVSVETVDTWLEVTVGKAMTS